MLPVSVCEARPATPGKWLAPYIADSAIVSCGVLNSRSCRYREVRATGCRSAPTAALAIALTTSTGYDPTAVSAESMTASVPSSTALATSNTSARVGIEFSIIDSIICVAVITIRSRFRVLEIKSFWMPISWASPTSMPRSPRATITPSQASIMSSSRALSATTSARSILAIIAALTSTSLSSSLASSISLTEATKETATKSGLIVSMLLMSALSLSVRAGAAIPPPSLFTPFLELNFPPTITVQLTVVSETLSTRRRILPSSKRRISSTTRLLGRSLYSMPTQELSPSSASLLRLRSNASPAVSMTEPSRNPAMRIFGPCRSASTPTYRL